MSEMVDDGKRDFLKQATLFGAAAGAAGAAMAPGVTLAQVLDTGVRDELDPREMPQGGRAARGICADRTVVL